MNEPILTSTRDALLFGIPFIAVLFVSIFRVGERVRMKKKPSRKPVILQPQHQGQYYAPMFSDPDGTPWQG